MEAHMPYVTRIERLAKEEGRDEGLRMGIFLAIKNLLASALADAGLALVPGVEALASTDRLKECLALAIASTIDETRTFLGNSK